MIEQKVEAYIERWGGGMSRGGNERANLQMFITELCTLLDLPQPEPATAKRSDNAYIFERSVTELFADGGKTTRALDLYKRGCFILEGKDTGKQTHSDGWDAAITKALKQAENYARSLPAEEGRPPFIIVADVGKSLALYSEFSLSGGNYVAYPDPRSHKIPLEKLRDAETRELLKRVWLDPKNLDPTRYAGKITRVIADQLAKLAKSLEDSGHPAEQVASFLMRCLFTMFSEDVGLLPARGFTELLERLKAKPESFCKQLRSLWQTMNAGGFAPALDTDVLKFNGGLFADAQVIELNMDQLNLLTGAAKADWRYVEPAIFGTLLERALNPRERHKLGAHYTPRAYVERLVLPTIIEPLRAEWAEVQAAALTYKQQRKTKEAVSEIRKFHHQLCQTRVLDPACGSGNFLYVTLEHMKRLEGEVLEVLGSIVKSGSFELEGLTVDPHQFLGMEVNPRAAKIAEMVLWIGYLQWHFRTYGKVNPPEPVLRDFHNIEYRDALINYDTVETITDDFGKPVTRWDGMTFKPSSATGEKIPDDSAQVEQFRYINPRKAEWPQSDYIVGNPPFIGASTMRRALGEGYVDAVRRTWPAVPESADFVMHWWHIAAEAVRSGKAKRFGFITTNSIKQTFNRRVVQAQLGAKNPLSLAFAIPDHPWVDAADGAAVRIAMTVGTGTEQQGNLLIVREETSGSQDDIDVKLQERQGRIFADLKIGPNLTGARPLQSNLNVSSPGVKLHGAGFIVTKQEANELGLGTTPGLEKYIRNYRNGRDLTQSHRGFMVIDLFGLTVDNVRERFPNVYQFLLERVKQERDAKGHTKDGAGYAAVWWVFGKPRQALRKQLAGLPRYIATVETMKHRSYQFIDADILPDNRLICFALDSAFSLGVLSSRIHVVWALATGGTLEDRPVYNKTCCFETFPFPEATAEQQETIRVISEKLDAHRKRQQGLHPELQLTEMYNVLEKLRAGVELNVKDKVVNAQGLVSMLRELHDDLDRAVFAAYGWDDLAKKLIGLPGATTPLVDKPETQAEAEEELLQCLVDLNALRASEEARGQIRWLRPDYQNPNRNAAPEQAEAELEEEEEGSSTMLTAKIKKMSWPKGMREQIAAVRSALSTDAMTPEAIAANFKEPKKTSPLILEALIALEELGMVYRQDDHYRLAS
ncbi:DNA methyltransferase [Pseudomonas syringae group genomosp. 3]|nr:DNA methyltransferase [Pseudomonas syringae group genomosp. 3]